MSGDELTLWQAMRGRSQDLMAARPAFPAVVTILYGIYKFFTLGFSTEHYLYTYVPVIGGIASVAAIVIYSNICSSGNKGFFAMCGALSGFVPYALSLYVLSVFGIYGIWQSINPLDIWGLTKGLIWIVLGYHMLRKFWIITELASLSVKQENLAEILGSKLGMKPRELAPLLSDTQVKEHLFNEMREGDAIKAAMPDKPSRHL